MKKTVKLSEKTIYHLKKLQSDMYIDQRIKMNTYDEAIHYLYLCYLNIAKQEEEKLINDIKDEIVIL